MKTPERWRTLLRRALFPSRVSGRGYKMGPVCVCVCVRVRLLVSALTDEPIDVQTQNSAEELTLTISRTSSKVKVIGQRSRSLGWKTWIFEVSHGFTCEDSLCNAIWLCHGVTPWRHVKSRRDIMMSCDIMVWRHDVIMSGKPFCYDILCHVTSWRLMTSQRDVLTWFDDLFARILTKRARRGRARQRSGVFISL